MAGFVDHYAVLGVPPSATPQEVRTAYMTLAKRYHPDTNGAVHAGRFSQITYSYSILKNKTVRAAFDAECRLLLSPCAACKGAGVTLAQHGFGKAVKRSCVVCSGSGRATKV